jgi:metallo-beta-lactamase class B
MIGAATAALWASAVLAWGLPAGALHPTGIFGPDTALEPREPIRGSLDKEIIRRVIRTHINEVKACYEQGLATQPLLAGRVMAQFTIGAAGDVVASTVQHSTLNDAAVESCTTSAVRRWKFPSPVGGGIVIVSYPFVFTPEPIKLLAGGGAAAGGADIQPINARFFVHVTSDAKGVPANGLVAVLPKGLLLVDTGWTEKQTYAILHWGDETLRLPWIGAIITHDHPDRGGGLAALAQRQIPVAASDLTVAKLTARGVRGVDTLFTARAATLADPRGFEAFYPGPGHTTDNIVVAFPDAHVVFGGCLFKAIDAPNLGFTGDADRAAWPASVQRVADRYPWATVIPGHGDYGAIDDAAARTRALLGVSAPAAGSSSAAAASPAGR